ncbi:MAG: DUF4193 domain-containing protein [Mycobacterium sp.]|nr:DUF4193 domain-containing protein [Mycobacterium sp.]
MTVDYDAPRRASVEAEEESLADIAGRRNDPTTATLDTDDSDPVESYELPGADLSGEELMVRVVPKQPDEFTCSRCFLVQHRSRLARGPDGDGHQAICSECA